MRSWHAERKCVTTDMMEEIAEVVRKHRKLPTGTPLLAYDMDSVLRAARSTSPLSDGQRRDGADFNPAGLGTPLGSGDIIVFQVAEKVQRHEGAHRFALPSYCSFLAHRVSVRFRALPKAHETHAAPSAPDQFTLELSKLDSWDDVAKAVAVHRWGATGNWQTLRFTSANFRDEPKPRAVEYRRSLSLLPPVQPADLRWQKCWFQAARQRPSGLTRTDADDITQRGLGTPRSLCTAAL
jgi:hypothetical protein